MRPFLPPFSFLIAIALPAGSLAQEVSGTVHNQQDRPVAAVQLRWSGPNGIAATNTTDADGRYQLALPRPTPVNGATAELPVAFSLGQNYPNPFNPETIIPFQLATSTTATLTIYNISGQAVRTLLSGPLSPGPNQVIWDGRDNPGNAVAVGVYIYRLTAGWVDGKMYVIGGGTIAGLRASNTVEEYVP